MPAAEILEPAAQSYEYTRQDGTVEYAADREEAIRLCPVLGKVALSDPETANLLLDMASLGQAKMAEVAEVEPARPELPQPTRSVMPKLEKLETAELAEPLPETIIAAAVSVPEVPRDVVEILEMSVREAPHVTAETEAAENAQPVMRQPRADHVRVEASETAAPDFDASPVLERLPVAVPVAAETVVELAEQADIEPPRQPESTAEPPVPERLLSVEQLETVMIEADVDLAESSPALYVESPAAEVPLEFTNEFAPSIEPEVTQDSVEVFAAEAEALPAVVAVVLERIAQPETEDQEPAAAALTEIIALAQALAVLEVAETAEPETIAAAEAELEERVAALFKELGIVYETEDAAQFIAAVSQPGFQLSQPGNEAEEIVADLEHDGTHEAKMHLASTGFVADIEHRLERLLGMFALLTAAAR